MTIALLNSLAVSAPRGIATAVSRTTFRSQGILAAETVDLSLSWDQFWGSFRTAVGEELLTLITMVGMLLVVGAVLKWLWDRRRGNGGGGMGGANAILWTLLLGATLAAPGLLIPLFLNLLDGLANAFVSVMPD